MTSPLKVLHVAVFNDTSTNNFQADAFEALGHTVIRYNYRVRALELKDSTKRDLELVKLCEKEKPKIVLFSKCNGMATWVLEKCAALGAITVLWYMDNFHNIDLELLHKIETCNYVFCSTTRSVNTALKYNKNSYRLTGGFDPKIHNPQNIQQLKDTAFIGSLHSNRKSFHDVVNFPIFSGVYGDNHAKLVSETKINLNFTEGDGVSNRIYKIMGAGGFLLTMPWDEINEDFIINKDLVIFTTPKELKEKINYYLINEKERKSIAALGRQKALKRDNINYANTIINKVT